MCSIKHEHRLKTSTGVITIRENPKKKGAHFLKVFKKEH